MKKISYFSYKGGAGRSSLAYNTIPFIAEKLGATPEHPILLLDLDIDSAGMTFLLGCGNLDSNTYSVQDVINGNLLGLTRTPDDTPLSAHPFFNHLIPVGDRFGLKGNNNRSILFLPIKTVSEVSLKTSFDAPSNSLVKVVKMAELYDCKAIIFDTPTGDQLTAKWAFDISKEIVTAMKITYQFREGTLNFLRRKDREYGERNFIIVPNCVPRDPIYIDGNLFNYTIVRNDIKDNLLLSIKNNKVNVEMLEGEKFGVPEVKRFKLKEGIIYTLAPEKLTPDELEALDSYKHVVDIICR